MIRAVLQTGLLAGLCAGLLVAILQHFSATPLILKAETYEIASVAVETAPREARLILAAHAHGGEAAAPHEHDEGWKPEEGLQRTLATSLVSVASAIGFALLLLGAMLAGREPIDVKMGALYGVAGFLAFGLAPAAGLAPELPGAAAVPLAARQIWWLCTALLTAFALWAILRRQSPILALLALAFAALPHLIGAPHPPAFESRVPAELAARFAALSLALQASLWIASGAFAGLFWAKSRPDGVEGRR